MIHRVTGRARTAGQPPPLPQQPLRLEACYHYCESLARSRRHNFPVASWFAPANLRRHVFALYAFARTADDFVDEARFDGRRELELDRWEERLEECFHGEPPTHPVFVALQDTIRRFDLPITPFMSMISGFRMDLEERRFQTAIELTNYALLAAAPIGQLMLYITSYRDASLHRYADDLATAMAFASFWQDIRTDLDRDRVYLPMEDLRHFDLTEQNLFARRSTPAVDALIRYQVARTRALFQRSRPLIEEVGSDLALELAMIWHGGMRILDKIGQAGGRVLERRPRLTELDKGRVVARAMAWRGRALLPRMRSGR